MDELVSIITWLMATLFLLLMFPVTILIWLVTLPFGNSDSAVHRWVTFQCSFLIRSIPLWRVTCTGKENLTEKTCVIVANHQSILDIPLIHILGGDFRWVSKESVFRIPLLGATMRMAGYIPVIRGNAESVTAMMNRAEEYLKEGVSVILFPEGTRTKDGEVKRFRSGAFRLALSVNMPVQPVVIDGTAGVLPKKGIVFSRGCPVKIRVLPAVMPDGFPERTPDRLAHWFEQDVRDQLELLRRTDSE
ncbi:MAG: 1-acyl-sn-glycerol-3-phosphate acyltransferase [Bacteroidales bacterium]|nr:1-acyl-sn-glycerol-3-phosphate acyltransferase [Bacteroidales bacterium]